MRRIALASMMAATKRIRPPQSGHSMKAIQAQLGHRLLKSAQQYAHLGKRAQLRIVADLEPPAPKPSAAARAEGEARRKAPPRRSEAIAAEARCSLA